MINQLRSLIKRAFQSASLTDSGTYSVGQASYLGKTSKYEQIFPYGYSASPPLKTEILMFNVMGQEQNLAGIPYSTESRFKNLKSGEVMFGNPGKNTSIKFDELGNIIITTTEQDVIVNSARDVIINSANNTNIVSSNQVNITATQDINITTTNQTVNVICKTANITASQDANVTAGRDAKIIGNRDVDVTATTRDVNVTASRFIKLTAGTRVDIVGNLVVSGNITDGTGKTMASIITKYNGHSHTATGAFAQTTITNMIV